MADYSSARATAQRLIKKFGTTATLRRVVSEDSDKPWKAKTQQLEYPTHAAIFADTGEVFINHNIQGNLRVAVLAPSLDIKSISIGDSLVLPHETVEVLKVKALDPDTSGAILWTLLIQ